MIFESFSVILRQISLGVHSYAVVHFPCLTKKSFKNRDFWVFAVTLGQISLGVPTVRRRSFSLSYEKILQKSRLWVFSVILRQISLGVPTVRHRLFSLSYEKILQKSRFLGLCRNVRLNITRNTFVRCRSFSDRATKCVTRFTFNTNFNLCHSSG